MNKKFLKIIFPLGYPNEKIIFLHKIGSLLYKKNFVRLSIVCEYIILRKFNCAISSQAMLHSSIKFPHPVGIVIGAGVKVHENVTIYQNVTIGRKDSSLYQYPEIKKNCVIYSNSVIIGNEIIEENTIIGANTTVNFGTEKSSIYVGSKARKIK